jgi:hypothetical protein
MPTITPEEEALIQRALKGVRDGKYSNLAFAACQNGCNYNVLYARFKGIQGNWLKGGKNKRLADEEEATLVCYYKRRILANDPLEREHITAAANSILRATGKKRVLKQWVTQWTKAHPNLLHKWKMKPLYAEQKAVHEAEDIAAHFRRFEAAKKEYNIKDENIYNADETE